MSQSAQLDLRSLRFRLAILIFIISSLSLSFVASAFRFTLTTHSVKMSKRKHSAYTIDSKLQILSEAEEKKLTKTEICKKHSIPNSTLSTILKDTEKLQKVRDDSKF
ncbi:tigger transposable element-derived protein 4-like isoform [Elysia marginata]|uniref:Tigger transposable element-derived protein 4-like isoform n=1 Tax=Elysia marginata TaxID=1093978 RepID=A0AAV4HJC5_9GAST|nr:tigger transposable element-derived protein 4-like isoform [Elysia marginata]